MLDDFRLKAFMAVAGTGSFTKAARSLGVSQPAISQNISELERLIGGSLFERGRGSSISLTPKGEEFLPYARQILYWYEAASNVFVEGATRVTPPTTVEVDASTSLEISASQGDVHIKILKK